MPLTDVVLRRLKPETKTVRIADEKGLYLQVAPSGGMWWRLKFRFEGKEKCFALGVYPEVSLKEAREKRDAARAMLRDGIDPSANRKARKTAEAKAGSDSFEVVAREWHDKFSPTWDSVKYRDITLRRLELNLFPWLGNRTILDEVLGFRPDIIEHQLAHTVKDPNGRAYNRTAHFAERRVMMQRWADYLDELKQI